MSITYRVPARYQGQIIEIAYAWDAGDLFRRIYDRSDQTVLVHQAVIDDDVDRERLDLAEDDTCLDEVVSEWRLVWTGRKRTDLETTL